MKQLKSLLLLLLLVSLGLIACEKDDVHNEEYTYYEVGLAPHPSDWRDTAFVVRTKNPQLIQQIEAQLSLPVVERKLVFGTLVKGSGGYNKNGAHPFKWHFKEDDWSLVDVTAEIYDGRPYSDVDLHLDYWLGTLKRYGSWGSYIRRKLPGKP